MHQVTSRDGTPIAFDRSGQGPSLILVDGALCQRTFGPFEPPYVAAEANAGEADHLAHLTQLIAAGERGAAVRYFMKDMVRAPGPMVALMQLMFPIWSKLKAVAHTLPYDATILGNWSIPAERAGRVSISTLVANGAKSDPRLRSAAKMLADAIPGAEHAELAGQTHNASADSLAPMLARFFLSCSSA